MSTDKEKVKPSTATDLPAPWVATSEATPPDSQAVIITDAINISNAHYFAELYHPATGKHSDSEWANQFERITGGWIETPTHWMSIESFKRLMFSTGEGDTLTSDEKDLIEYLRDCAEKYKIENQNPIYYLNLGDVMGSRTWKLIEIIDRLHSKGEQCQNTK